MSALDALLGNVKSDGVDVELGGGLNVKAPLSATYNPTSKVIDVEIDVNALGGVPDPSGPGDVLTSVPTDDGFVWSSEQPRTFFVYGVSTTLDEPTNVSSAAFAEVLGPFSVVSTGPLAYGPHGKLTNNDANVTFRMLVTFQYTCDRDNASGGFVLEASIDHDNDTIGQTAVAHMHQVDVPNNKYGFISVQRYVALGPGQAIKPCIRVGTGTYSGSVVTLHASISAVIF